MAEEAEDSFLAEKSLEICRALLAAPRMPDCSHGGVKGSEK